MPISYDYVYECVDIAPFVCIPYHYDNICYIFLYINSCGQYTLFSFSWPGARPNSDTWNGLHYTVRQPPFTTAELLDMDYKVDFSTVTTNEDRVAVIATKPLTKNETWIEMKKGELLMFDKGLPYSEANECEIVEREGRGLTTRTISYDGLSNIESTLSVHSIMIPDNVKSFDQTCAGSTQISVD